MHPDAFTRELALNLWSQSLRLAALGRREEALAAATEAVTLYRELAAVHPDAFTPQLARALAAHSSALADLGRYEDALTASTEALDMFRRLAVQRRAVFVPDVARLLVLQGRQLAGLSDFEGAVSAGREAVSIYTALVSVDTDRDRDMYEQAMQSLTHHLKGLGRTEREIAGELDRLGRGD